MNDPVPTLLQDVAPRIARALHGCRVGTVDWRAAVASAATAAEKAALRCAEEARANVADAALHRRFEAASAVFYGAAAELRGDAEGTSAAAIPGVERAGALLAALPR